MTKTTAPRVRQTNLYTVERDGLPVAQAMAISQAEAVRLYIESVQQPAMTARLSSPLEARTLAGLPLLQREPAATDDKTLGLFDDAPAAPVSPVVGAVVDAEWSPSGDLATVLDGGPASALPAEFVAYIDGQEPAAAPTGEPAGCLDDAPTAREPATACSGPTPLNQADMFAAYQRGRQAVRDGLIFDAVPSDLVGRLLTDLWRDGWRAETRDLNLRACGYYASSGLLDPTTVPIHLDEAGALEANRAAQEQHDAAHADAPTHAESMASAYAAGIELGRQGVTRWGKEFTAVDEELTAKLSDEDGNAVNDELLRGFEFGRAALAEKKPELKRRAEAAAARAGGKIVPRYRHPDGQTWTGRGLKPRWLVGALEAGHTLDEFLIEGAQA